MLNILYYHSLTCKDNYKSVIDKSKHLDLLSISNSNFWVQQKLHLMTLEQLLIPSKNPLEGNNNYEAILLWFMSFYNIHKLL